jgi:hypothetical protein
MNRKVGAAKSLPDSRMPRRFATAMPTTAATQSAGRYGKSSGTADVSAATPAATLTATVRT